MSLYDQPDYSRVDHPSCEDPAEPETCDACGKLLANQADPASCQCPDDEPALCRSCGEAPALTGYEYCAGCLQVTRESIATGKRAAHVAELAGDTLRTDYIRLQLDGYRADGTARS